MLVSNNVRPVCGNCNEGELQESLNENLRTCFFKIHNIFSESAYPCIPQWCKDLSSYNQLGYDEQLYKNPMNKVYTSIQFDANHKIVDSASYFNKGYPNSPEINPFISALIERFARELKLVDTHEINVDFYRTRYASQEIDIENFQLGWHFDQFAKSTIVAVFQNDFPYDKGQESGLDIAENRALAPMTR